LNYFVELLFLLQLLPASLQSSLVRLAICRYALNEFAEAHARLEEALICAKVSCSTLEDRLQMAGKHCSFI